MSEHGDLPQRATGDSSAPVTEEKGTVPAHVMCPFCSTLGVVADNIVFRACAEHEEFAQRPMWAGYPLTWGDEG